MKTRDVLFTGLMLFSLFFGAGNLIFPPYLGMEAGTAVWPAVLGFIVTGVGLPLLSVAAVAFAKDGIRSLGNAVHPLFSLCFSLAVYLAIGPFFGIPRAASVAYEIGAKPFFPESGSLVMWLFTGLFFALVYWLSLNPSKLVDRIGQLLTPVLLLSIAVLCLTGLIRLDDPQALPAEKYASAPFVKGMLEGYLTMDTIAALAFGIVVIHALRDRGVDRPALQAKATVQAGLIAGLGLALVYGGIAIIGARMAGVGSFANGAELLSYVSSLLFGSGGKLLLGVIVALACLTTAVGLVAACAQYFQELTPTVSYRTYVIVLTLFSFLMSNLGLNALIAVSVPVLTMLYPLAIVLVALSFFRRFYRGSAKVYGMALLFTGVFSLYDGLKTIGLETAWLEPLLSWAPLFSVGLGWVVPALIGAALGLMIDRPSATKRKHAA
ncbi:MULTISPECIES: branched-chain amino acid transport system II carrier protein [Geobacillus]|uniref:branched-chain amino acid transport system II carrier protein n=1 Tax=Geobacillus TaxID=129337 RepID=UPI0005CCDD35|nr:MULTISPECIES: branched-chain amino acid transport system II carrier protein [Geobacillus]AKM20497.1 Branched-chain amino acid transport system 2 carrier protein [Geobacillus sp. 12AMOR1]MDF9298243.1 branched-chain amino acid transport system II carrier protein [Geobacillus stearothermophilus]PJW13854.1 branched-chain amino acid transport system II carrier protein [Geobacillus sp. Manikaran-105]QOR84106.1 branched-chain amino acid transport system II carrier protein [Geobacillus stearothermop